MGITRISQFRGLLTGAAMALVLLLIQVNNPGFTPALNMATYLILAVVIAGTLVRYKSRLPSNRIFPRGMLLGNMMSLFAGLTLVVANVLLFAISRDLVLTKYALQPTQFTELMVVSAALFFETVVFGMIVTFITLQFLKERVRL